MRIVFDDAMFASFRVICLLAAVAALPAGACAGASNEALFARSETDRASIFSDIIQSASRNCSDVTEIFYKGESTVDAADYYAIQCLEGDYMVAMQNDGSNEATVVVCATAKLMGSNCWEPF